MKIKFTILATVILFFLDPTFAQWGAITDTKSTAEAKNTPNNRKTSNEELSVQQGTNMEGLAQTILKVLPENAAKVIQTYIEVARPRAYNKGTVGGSNIGIQGYYREEIKKDTCFSKAAADFYIKLKPVKLPKRVTINQKISDFQKEPGWIWEKAMVAANGNPNLAMKIIGICGHDDILNSQYRSYCPSRDTDFFAPEALGKGVDISPEVRKLVIDSQSVTMDADRIAAKNYHIYMGQ